MIQNMSQKCNVDYIVHIITVYQTGIVLNFHKNCKMPEESKFCELSFFSIFFWIFIKIFLIVFSLKLFRTISTHKYVRIVETKYKVKSNKTNSIVFKNLRTYKYHAEQLLISAVVLWCGKIVLLS